LLRRKVASRAAKVDDKLITRNFGTDTRGFASPDDPNTAICLLPGTELAFAQPIQVIAPLGFSTTKRTDHRLAIFRQVNKRQEMTHHDALEFPHGSTVLLTILCEGQQATVLQLPARPTTPAEEEAQKRVA
jgi:hypothetical protein